MIFNAAPTFALISCLVLGLLEASTSSSAPAKIHGFKNSAANCYLNALLASMYGVTPLRKLFYDRCQDTQMTGVVSSVFARFQLGLMNEAIDLEADMFEAIRKLEPSFEIGRINDPDEMFKVITKHCSAGITENIGFFTSRSISVNDFVISRGSEQFEEAIIVPLPEIKMGKGSELRLEDMIMKELIDPTTVDYTLNAFEHSGYYHYADIPFTVEQVSVKALTAVQPSRYTSVVPVFIRRRITLGNRRETNYRKDPINIPSYINLPLLGREPERFKLFSFVAYVGVHYISFVWSTRYNSWYKHNDSRVTLVTDFEEFSKLLSCNTTLLFYVRDGVSEEPEIPDDLAHWARFMMIVQHMNSHLVDRIKKLAKKSK